MDYSITALVAKAPASQTEARKYDLPLFFHNDFVIVALNFVHADYWAEKLGLIDKSKKPIILDCRVTHFFAKALGFKTYAIVDVDVFLGQKQHHAAVYEEGREIMPTLANGINLALKLLGVECRDGKDEFHSIELGEYTSFDELFEKYWNKL